MIYKYKDHIDSNLENFQTVYLIYTEYIYISVYINTHFTYISAFACYT